MAYLYAYVIGPTPPKGWELVDMEKFRQDAERFSRLLKRNRRLIRRIRYAKSHQH